ncbi:hypothetical protein EHM92_00185 [bacterium]|nr:MAG: hypothetical protein EHM92_00185 [bacterium]
MARIRQIKPEFFLDDGLASSCCRDARLLFVGLWTLADREGRLEDRPAKIKAQVFPYDDDATLDQIVTWLDQLASESCILRYEVDGRRYLWIRNMKLHQHFHRDEQGSKLPEPPQDIEIHRTSTVQAPQLHPTCTPTSTSTYDLQHMGSAPKKRRTSQKTGCPESFPIDDHLKEWASRKVPGLNVEDETENFLDHHRAKGNSFADWDAAWRSWMKKAVKFAQGNNGTKSYKPDTIGAQTESQGDIWDQARYDTMVKCVGIEAAENYKRRTKGEAA